MDVGANIHKDSLLYRLCRHQPLISTTGKMLLRQHPVQMRDIHTGQAGLTSARIVSIDNGNDAFKGAMMHLHEPFLRTKRIVTAYVPAREVRAGEGVVTWQVNDSEAFCIGVDAISARQSESLPIGFTE